MAKRPISELAKDLERLRDELIKQAPKITLEIAQNGAALAIRRVQKEGIPGKQYSTKPLFATRSMFNRQDKFEPTPIASELGRDENGKLVKGGTRNKAGKINQRKVKKRVLFIKFKNMTRAVPVMILPGGYKQLRSIQGLQVAKVDLTYSARMLQNTKVLKQQNDGTKYLAFIGATNQEEKDKLAANFKRYGAFLDPEKDELKLLEQVGFERVKLIFDQIFNK